MPNYAEWVSTLALLVGAASLAWQVARARREQPVISVDGQWSVGWEEGRGAQVDASWHLPVHVTNAGGRAVTVVDVYWELATRAGPLRVTSTDMGTVLPTRLEALSADAWEARIPVEGMRWTGLTGRPAADVVLRNGVVTVYGPPGAPLTLPDIGPR